MAGSKHTSRRKRGGTTAAKGITFPIYYHSGHGQYAQVFKDYYLYVADALKPEIKRIDAPGVDFSKAFVGWKITTDGKWRAVAEGMMLLNSFQKKGAITPAFELDGRIFYEYANPADMPVGRFMQREVVYQEVASGLTGEIIDIFLAEVEKATNEGKLGDALLLIREMKIRRKIAMDEETIFKLASIVYFDQNEDTTGYSFEYAKQKIDFWKEKGGADFFLSLPLRKIIGLIDISERDLKIASEAAKMMKELKAGSYLERLANSMPQAKEASA